MFRNNKAMMRSNLCKYTLKLALPLSLLSLLSLGACVKRPDKVMSDQEMAPIVADYELARACERGNSFSLHSGDDDGLLMSVLRSHKVSREEYDSTIAWYSRNPDKYYILCEKVEKELDAKQRKYAGKGESLQFDDLWPYGRMMMFSGLASSDGLDFSIPSSEVEPGQKLRLNMRFNTRAEGVALLGVEYEDGVKAYNTKQLSDRKLELNLQTDTARRIRRIFGNLTIDSQSKLPLWADSVSLASLPFDSLEYYRIHSQKIYRKPIKKVKREVQDSVSGAAD